MEQLINEALRERVKLEKLYPWQFEENLHTDGKPCAGQFIRKTGEIFLNAFLKKSPNRIIPVYLHEVGHLIAHKFKLDESLDADAHNQYFAVLVAVMYRRANMLEWLKIYDFCDTKNGQRTFLRDSPMLDDEALIKRFRYILRRSSALAESPLSIEQIAQKIFMQDALTHWRTGEFHAPKKNPISWIDVTLGVLLGVASTSAAAVAAAHVFL